MLDKTGSQDLYAFTSGKSMSIGVIGNGVFGITLNALSNEVFSQEGQVPNGEWVHLGAVLDGKERDQTALQCRESRENSEIDQAPSRSFPAGNDAWAPFASTDRVAILHERSAASARLLPQAV